VLGIAIGLAMDTFSVAIGVGISVDRPTVGHYFRIPFHFGLFQFMMPIIGYFAGAFIGPWIGSYDHWTAMVLLSLVGVNMIRGSFSSKRKAYTSDPSRGWMLVTLSLATSIDALAVGLSLGFLDESVVLSSVVIGIVSALFSIFGITIGKKAGSLLGKHVERAGGLILVMIGAKILLDHIA
jgi:putative Mn2+ efflux pump MntP